MTKYQDPNSDIPQYSLEYLRSLRASGENEELVRLFNAGHFVEAEAEEAQRKVENRRYYRRKAAGPNEMKKWQGDGDSASS
ncbi:MULTISPECIES: hypothetical protein [Streptomyces]|uniref:Uncharacterized protein n=1 Tax=Streptomyces sp. CMC78 TaxID=3231512 RepID=A0AB33K8D9_9ACTN